MRLLLTVILSVFLFTIPVFSQSEKPQTIIVPTGSLGNISEVRKKILEKTLESALNDHFDIVPKDLFEEAQEKAFEELDYEECTEEQCIMMIKEILQVENSFQLVLMEEDGDTQISLTWNDLDKKRVEVDFCEGCQTKQLMRSIDDLVLKLFGKSNFEQNKSSLFKKNTTFNSADNKVSKSITSNNKNNCQYICDDLVAYYPFNGDFKDYSGNNLDTQNQGIFFAKDKNDENKKAIYLNGNSKLIINEQEKLSFVDEFSLSIWIKPEKTTGSIISKWYHNNNSGSFVLYVDGSDQYGFRLNDGTSNFIEVKDYYPPLNKWSLLTATFLNPDAKIYLNDKLISQKRSYGELNKDENSLWIGKDGYNIGFKGILDDIRIYSRELKISEIKEIFEKSYKTISNFNLCPFGDKIWYEPKVLNCSFYSGNAKLVGNQILPNIGKVKVMIPHGLGKVFYPNKKIMFKGIWQDGEKENVDYFSQDTGLKLGTYKKNVFYKIER